jgi:hypothetical protein
MTYKYTTTITLNQSTQLADALYGLFSTYTSDVSHTSGSNYITFMDSIKVSIDHSSPYSRLTVKTYNDSDTEITSVNHYVASGDSGTEGEYTVTIIVGDEISFFNLQRENRGVTFCWCKKDSNKFFAYGPGQMGPTMNMQNLQFIKNGTYETDCKVRTAGSFNLTSPNIFFLDNAILSGPSGMFSLFTEIKTCSNVVPGTTVTTNSKNYLAIGTNHLAEANVQ